MLIVERPCLYVFLFFFFFSQDKYINKQFKTQNRVFTFMSLEYFLKPKRVFLFFFSQDKYINKQFKTQNILRVFTFMSLEYFLKSKRLNKHTFIKVSFLST
jgi:hypothetical protein